MRRLCLLVVVLGLSSCASQIEHKLKTPAMLSSEAQGGWPRFEFGGGIMSAPKVQITDSVFLHAPDRTRSRVIQEGKIFLHGGVGVLDRLDVTLDPASWINFKYQFLGEPFTRSAKGNFSVSGLLSAWSEIDDDSDDLNFSATTRYTKEATAWRAGALVGYRVLDPLLIYGGLNYQEHRYSGNFSSPSIGAGRYAGRATAEVAVLGLEASVNKAFVIRVEDAYSTVRIREHNARSSQHSFGLLLAGALGFGKATE